MSYENYVKIMEILANYNLGFKDYICLPKAVWNKIKADYRSKYSSSNPKPTLDPINIGVVKRKQTEENIVKEDNSVEKLALKYFEKEIIEMRED